MRSDQGTYDTQAAKEISLETITQIMQDLRVSNIYVKSLSPNDNSKNQPYLGSHLTDLPFIPTSEITASTTASKKIIQNKNQISSRP